MPRSAKEVQKLDHLSMLVIGPVRVGKTRTCLETGQALGKWYVFCADPEARLRPASDVCDFKWDPINSTRLDKLEQQFENAMGEADRGIKAGEYQGVMFDTVTSFSFNLLMPFLAAAGGKGVQTAYHDYGTRLLSKMGRFAELPCHKICLAHDYQVAAEMDGQVQKKGPGILPACEGSVRARIPGLFEDICYFEKKPNSQERSFVWSLDGMFGPGSSNLPASQARMPADVAKAWAMMKEFRAKGFSPKPAVTKTAK